MPQCGGLTVYLSMYNMAEVCLSMGGLIVYQICTIWARNVSVWWLYCISKIVQYGQVVSDCILKYVGYGRGVHQCGGQIVYQNVYDMAEVCLSVKA